jgi:hypothetical protein
MKDIRILCLRGSLQLVPFIRDTCSAAVTGRLCGCRRSVPQSCHGFLSDKRNTVCISSTVEKPRIL